MRSQPTAAGPIVEVDSLTKTYNGRARALDGLSLSVAAGTIYGLLGPNGAGKTTLIRVLATLLPPDHGTARVAGLDVRTDPTAVRARIGLAGQYAAVDELLTGYENVEMVGRLYGLPPRQARQRARDVNWLIPGLLAQFALFGGGATASGLVEDLNKGVIDRFRSLPMARSAVLAGRTFSDLLRSALTLTLMLAVGTAIGFRVQTNLAGLLGAVGIALLFGYAWSWAMAVIALSVRTAEAVQAAVYMGVFPLAFTSSVFVPTQTMPGWLQPFAANQPITVVTNALRGLILGPGALQPGQSVTGQVLLALAWSAAIIAVFAPLAVRAYRRAVR